MDQLQRYDFDVIFRNEKTKHVYNSYQSLHHLQSLAWGGGPSNDLANNTRFISRGDFMCIATSNAASAHRWWISSHSAWSAATSSAAVHQLWWLVRANMTSHPTCNFTIQPRPVKGPEHVLWNWKWLSSVLLSSLCVNVIFALNRLGDTPQKLQLSHQDQFPSRWHNSVNNNPYSRPRPITRDMFEQEGFWWN